MFSHKREEGEPVNCRQGCACLTKVTLCRFAHGKGVESGESEHQIRDRDGGRQEQRKWGHEGIGKSSTRRL